jgi:mono/diheme cytochrome c family protein
MDLRNRALRSLLLNSAIGICLLAQPLAAAAESAAKPVDFDRDIRPILSDNCYACHGPDEKQRQVNLRLDTKEGAFADRGGYRVIVPGDAAKSKLFQKITAENKALRMPPPGSERSLTAAQIDRIRRWIEQGARWETHWSYRPPQRPAIPKVKNAAWPRNPIDFFILARLESEGLRPSPEADKATLLRRLTFDLTGLPPTPAEVDRFLADKSPDAYEKCVDRLLRSPRYGERMAMQWLDLARYADTHGYHIDSHRDMWHWRDWVIQAFNRNMPFDQFTVEQIAGDLLPNATVAQRVATGFNRNHMINFEGGAIPEEYQVEYVVDRVEATANTWMAMTLGCARCHDHKYDPIRQKDFYRFYAFFNTISEKGLDGRKGNAEPVLPLPSPEQQRRLEELTRDIAAKEKAMPAEKELALLQKEWETTAPARLPPPSRDGLLAHYELDGSFADTSGRYQHGRTLSGDAAYVAGPVIKAADIDGQTHVSFGNVGDFDWQDAFSLALWLKPAGRLEMSAVQKIENATERRGYEICFDESQPIPGLKRGEHLVVRLIHRWPDDLIEVRTKERLALGTWYEAAVTYDGSGKAAGLKVYLDGKPAAIEIVHDRLSGTLRTASPLEIGNRKLGNPYKGQIDDFRIYSRMLTSAEIEQLAVREPVRATLSLVEGKRSKDQREKIREYFLTYEAAGPIREVHSELRRLQAEKERLEEAIPTTMVMQEMEKPRETFVLGRGDYRNRGEKVTPGVPSALPPLPKDAPANRLGLARWLVDPSHPLTARVAVNRYWQMYFGTGIVKTAEDFGSQGEPPSHPELLDWLATEFIRTGWDVKAMQRLIVTSAAYRQSSRATPELRERDPENRLLARGPRFRLAAEMVRDNALAVSGLLHEQIGGPGVFPYQPKGLWEEIAYGDVYSAQTYTPSHGSDLYRRSMYTFWKRTSPPPSLITFDAPDREKCTARRTVTNTPLQALVLMNDPTYVEAARALAQRMIAEAGRDPVKRVRFAFRLATARTPAPEEEQVLLDIARQKLADYRRDPEAASKLLQVGESPVDRRLNKSELAAWTTVASVILNLDETITKE